MGCDVRKTVSGFPTNLRFKPVSSATETNAKIEFSLIANLYMIRFYKGITKVLIRLSICAGWSAPLLFTNHQRQVFSR